MLPDATWWCAITLNLLLLQNSTIIIVYTWFYVIIVQTVNKTNKWVAVIHVTWMWNIPSDLVIAMCIYVLINKQNAANKSSFCTSNAYPAIIDTLTRQQVFILYCLMSIFDSGDTLLLLHYLNLKFLDCNYYGNVNGILH